MSLAPSSLPHPRPGGALPWRALDRNDGFAPGSPIVIRVPGLDDIRALRASGAAQLADIGASLRPSQPVALIDERTHARVPLWSELDATASRPGERDLVIHPAVDLRYGHTYAIALRNLRNDRDGPIRAPRWFTPLRASGPLPARERSQRSRYARIFAALRRAGIAREGLYAAWDFTISSERSLTSPLLAMRNRAFAQLGDHDLADGVPQGRAPRFAITATTAISPQARAIDGVFAVPCYLVVCGAHAHAGFRYRRQSLYATPVQAQGSVALAPFECVLPNRATPAHPARIALYGHGFLSLHTEVQAAFAQQLASGHNIALCATDWWGLAQPDAPFLAYALAHPAALGAVADRVQQAILNTLLLGRLMADPSGLASNAAFQAGRKPLIDTAHLYYDGNSDGGILGGIATALAPDFTRAVLGVTGLDFFGLMAQRGHAFSAFARIALHGYRDQSLHPLVLDLMQQLWERADPDAYAQRMTARPLPGTPAHTVLMQIAYGDFEVSNYAAAVEARTIGARAYEPALDLATDRARDRHLLFAVPPVPAFPFSGSAIVIYDSGPGHNAPPPLANLAPAPGPGNVDPHEDPRYTPAAQEQVSAFLEPAGAVIDVCAHMPCRSAAYAP